VDAKGQTPEGCISDGTGLTCQHCLGAMAAGAVAADALYDHPADVFALSALGAILNNDTIPLLETKIICSGANN
jgi:leucine dehydrogenase